MNVWHVFNLDLNRESVSEPRTLSGRLFQSLGAISAGVFTFFTPQTGYVLEIFLHTAGDIYIYIYT